MGYFTWQAARSVDRAASGCFGLAFRFTFTVGLPAFVVAGLLVWSMQWWYITLPLIALVLFLLRRPIHRKWALMLERNRANTIAERQRREATRAAIRAAGEAAIAARAARRRPVSHPDEKVGK